MTDLDPKNLPQLIVDGETFYRLPEIGVGIYDSACTGCSLFDRETGEREEICGFTNCETDVFVRPADLDRYKSLAVLQKLRV